eukprot:6654642-Alexandrium_andersonii.AAC.1
MHVVCPEDGEPAAGAVFFQEHGVPPQVARALEKTVARRGARLALSECPVAGVKHYSGVGQISRSECQVLKMKPAT